MINVTVERTAGKPEFENGELVELDPSQFPEKDRYIVLITGRGNSSTSFAGVIMHVSDKPDPNHFVGHHSNAFVKNAFAKFTGKLTMEQV